MTNASLDTHLSIRSTSGRYSVLHLHMNSAKKQLENLTGTGKKIIRSRFPSVGLAMTKLGSLAQSFPSAALVIRAVEAH